MEIRGGIKAVQSVMCTERPGEKLGWGQGQKMLLRPNIRVAKE